MNSPNNLKEKAKELAYSLGMKLYIRGDKICQSPPGEEIIPHPNHNPHEESYGLKGVTEKKDGDK